MEYIVNLTSGLVSPRRDQLSLRADVTEMNVYEGIGQIGDECSRFFPNVEEVHLPSTLKIIGDRAFNGCKDLKTLVLPDSVEYIGNYVFVGCALEHLNIPSMLEVYHRDMFACSALTTIKLRRQNIVRILDSEAESIFGGTNINRLQFGKAYYDARAFYQEYCYGYPERFEKFLRIFWGSPFAMELAAAEVAYKTA